MKRFAFALVCAVVAMLGSAALAETNKETDDATLNRIAGYRQWTRVNPEPVEVVVPVTRIAGTVSIDAMT
jgi:hypothetical protein